MVPPLWSIVKAIGLMAVVYLMLGTCHLIHGLHGAASNGHGHGGGSVGWLLMSLIAAGFVLHIVAAVCYFRHHCRAAEERIEIRLLERDFRRRDREQRQRAEAILQWIEYFDETVPHLAGAADESVEGRGIQKS